MFLAVRQPLDHDPRQALPAFEPDQVPLQHHVAEDETSILMRDEIGPVGAP